MSLTILFPTLVGIVGLVLYLLPVNNPKITQIGFAAFCCGLLVTLFAFSGSSFHIR